MIRDMLGGFTRVISVTGAIVATLLVLAILGVVNQHDKLLSMAAVVDGFADVFKWAGELLSLLLAKL
jgi:cobyrinic acid a,c-diamide synthase